MFESLHLFASICKNMIEIISQ